jgi:hypothetical protein
MSFTTTSYQKADNGTIQRNFIQIKQDIEDLKISELDLIKSDPFLSRSVKTKY